MKKVDIIIADVDGSNDIDAYEEDILWVRPESIDAFNKDSKGRVTIRIDGGAWTVLMTLNDFVKLINEQL